MSVSSGKRDRGARLAGGAQPEGLGRPAASPSERSYGSGARDPVDGIASTGLLTFAFFSIASHVLERRRGSARGVLWSVMFVIISVIYRPIEQLLSRTIAERRAHGHAEHPLRVPIAIQSELRADLPVAGAGAARRLGQQGLRRLHRAVLRAGRGYAGLRRQLLRARLAGGARILRLFGGLVLMESLSRLCFALAVALGITQRTDGGRAGDRGRAFVSLVRGARRVRPARGGAARGEHHNATSLPQRRSGAGGADHSGRGRCGFGGPGDRGRPGSRRARRAIPATGHGLRRLGVGHHAVRADAAERRRADRRGHLAIQSPAGDRVRRAADRARARCSCSRRSRPRCCRT